MTFKCRRMIVGHVLNIQVCTKCNTGFKTRELLVIIWIEKKLIAIILFIKIFEFVAKTLINNTSLLKNSLAYFLAAIEVKFLPVGGAL